MESRRLSLIKLLHLIPLLQICLIAPTWANEDQLEKKQQETIALLNHEIDLLVKDRNQCPGTDLVKSCGDKICDFSKGEDRLSCPADCIDSPIKSYNKQTICEDLLGPYTPQNASEISQIIANAYKAREPVKVVGTLHSATGVICTKGHVISTEHLKDIYGIENLESNPVVNTAPGVTVFELSEWLHQRGWALDGLPHMGFRDLTIAGAVATGSHGSSPKHTAVISHLLEEIELVDGRGHIKKLVKGESGFSAFQTSLGQIGVITRLKLRIQKQFNLKTKISFHEESELLEQKNLHDIVSECDYGQINWFPGQKKFMKTCGIKTTEKAHKKANNELLNPPIPSLIVEPFKVALQYGACNKKIMCLVEQLRYYQFALTPPLTKKSFWGNKKYSKEVIGPSHRMISSHLTKSQDGFFQMDWELAVPQETSMNAIRDIKKLTDQNKVCLPLVGVFIRFAKIEEGPLLAHSSASGGSWKKGDVAAFIEMPVYLPVGLNDEEKALYDHPYEEFARMLIEKHQARAHWGKNRHWVFQLQKDLGVFKQQREAFALAKKEFDPKGTFDNDFTAYVRP